MITFVFWLALLGSLGGSVVKNPPAPGDTGDMASIPGSGRSPRRRNGNLLQYYCRENPMDRGTWWAIVHGVAKSQNQLNMCTWCLLETNRILILHRSIILWKANKTTETQANNKHDSPNLNLVFCKMGTVTACKVVVREKTIWWSRRI